MKRYIISLSFLIFTISNLFAIPESISNLTAISTGTEGEVQLEWTSPDPADGQSTSTAYLVKYATSQINNSDFYSSWVSTYTQNWTALASSGTAESRALTGLTPGATLFFAIVAEDNGSNYGLWFSSDDVSGNNDQNSAVVLDSVPSQVSGVTLTGSDETIDVSWTQNPEIDITQYRIERSTYSNTLGFNLLINILSPGTTHQDVDTLINGNTYYYRILATDNSNNDGTFSTVASTTPFVVLGEPQWSADAVAISTETLNFAWDTLSDASGYRIFSSTSGDNISGDLGSSATYWQLSNLTPDTSAQVYVQAFNGFQISDSQTKLLYTLVNPPTNFYSPLQPGTTNINLSWEANDNPSKTRYSIERSTDGSTNWSTIVSLLANTTHQDTGLEKTTYYYRIWATNFDDAFNSATVSLSTVTKSINPQTPTWSFANTGTNDGDIDLQWIAPYDDSISEAVSAYVIRVATFSFSNAEFDQLNVTDIANNIIPAYPQVENLTVSGLYPGTTYYIGMKAMDEAGNYSNLSVIESTTSIDNLPPPPFNIEVSTWTNETQLRLAWSHPPMVGYDDRDQYGIYRATFNFTLLSQATFSVYISTTNFSYYDNNWLKKETTYWYMFTTVDLGDGPAGSGLVSEVLESTPSAVYWARTPDYKKPSAITLLKAAQGDSEGKILLTWVNPPEDFDTNLGDISGGKYRIDWTTDSAKTFAYTDYQIEIPTSTVSGTTSYHEITSLDPGVTYYARIWSVDESNNWSDISNAATTWAQVDITAPGAVTDLSATPLWRRINLAWTAPGDDNYSNDIGTGTFRIEYSTDSAFTVITTINISTQTAQGEKHFHLVTDLINEVTYYITIKTEDERNNWSEVCTDTAIAKPYNRQPNSFNLGLPNDGEVSSTSTPTLQWGTSTDDDSPYGDSVVYIVYYSTDMNFDVNITTITNVGNVLTHKVSYDLIEDATVYWKVVSQDIDGLSRTSSDIKGIRINAANTAPGSFSLIGPVAISTDTATPLLTWNVSTDIDPGDTITYTVDLSTSYDFSIYTSSAQITAECYETVSLSENLTYWWRVRSYDNTEYTWSNNTYYFRINSIPEQPTTFNLVSPNDNRELTQDVTFYWDVSYDPDPEETVSYNLVYSQYSDFFSSTTLTGINSTSTLISLPADNDVYYWKVTAVGSDGLSRESNQTNSFNVDIAKEIPGSFNLVDPGYGIVISTTLKPWFIWSAATDPDPVDSVRYYVDVSVNSDFAGSQPIPTGTDTFYQPLEDLLDQSTYYWRVRAAGYQGSPAILVDPSFVFVSTGVFVISMSNSPPQAFTMGSPSDNTTLDTKLPTFTWTQAVDTDLNDNVTYTIYISTNSDMSSIYYSVSDISGLEYTLTNQLLENKQYYWRVKANDKKGSEQYAPGTNSFSIPIINRPNLPVGIKGVLSSDESSFVLSWTAVGKNEDGTDIDDMAGYNIYRGVSLSSVMGNGVFAFVSAGTTQLTDSTIQGGRYYFMIKTVDTSGVESENSLVIDSLNPENLTLISSDQQVVAELPSSVSSNFLAENNQWSEDLVLAFRRRSDLEDPVSARILMVYELTVKDADLNEIDDYNFSTPVTLQFYYDTVFQASAPNRFAPSFQEKDLAIYWHNGVEFIRIGGYIDSTKERVLIRVSKPGQYQLRQAIRARSFGLASLNPSKVFTPGVAPYEKMTFYVDNPTGDKVTGKIFDLRGEFVADCVAVGDATALTAVLEWDGANARKGVYIYQLEGDGKVINGTIILAK